MNSMTKQQRVILSAAILFALACGGCSLIIDNQGKVCQSDVDCDQHQRCDTDAQRPICVDKCSDDCSQEGTSQCKSGSQAIQTCSVSADGCLVWQESQDCSDDSQFCDDSQATAQCVDTCTSNCSTLNETRCVGDMLQTCVEVSTCLLWEDSTDCSSSGGLCEDSGSAQCVAACRSALLSWNEVTQDVNQDPVDIAGYYVGWGTSSGTYPQGQSVDGNTSNVRIDTLEPNQTYYFVVKAIAVSSSESDWSDEITYTVPPTCN